ncbi:hypothetical protein JOB18_026122 [Solea senegalensis]|uniref:Uncharacterized protein n=1 Tax=Solea senegalensis TaxID=28829 RepID=A0AAV6T8N8_SOLSE|nr:hypothetical protein JOB18_026122 [Solea senegalensis]
MGSVTSALTRTRNALVKVGSEPESHQDAERSQSAPESDRGRKKSARFNVSIQTGRQSSRQSLSEVLNRQDSDGGKRTPKQRTGDSTLSVVVLNHDVLLRRIAQPISDVMFGRGARYNDNEMTVKIISIQKMKAVSCSYCIIVIYIHNSFFLRKNQTYYLKTLTDWDFLIKYI